MSFEDDEYWDEQYSDHSGGPNTAAVAQRRMDVPEGPQALMPTRRPAQDSDNQAADFGQIDELAVRRQRRAAEQNAARPAQPTFESRRPSWLDDPNFVPVDTSAPNLVGSEFADVDFNRPELGADFDAPDFNFTDPSTRQPADDPFAAFAEFPNDIDEPYDHRDLGSSSSGRTTGRSGEVRPLDGQSTEVRPSVRPGRASVRPAQPPATDGVQPPANRLPIGREHAPGLGEGTSARIELPMARGVASPHETQPTAVGRACVPQPDQSPQTTGVEQPDAEQTRPDRTDPQLLRPTRTGGISRSRVQGQHRADPTSTDLSRTPEAERAEVHNPDGRRIGPTQANGLPIITGAAGPAATAETAAAAVAPLIGPLSDESGPRIIHRATPPSAPRVISKATPPPAPRVLKRVEPTATPRHVANAPEPTARVVSPPAATVRPPANRPTNSPIVPLAPVAAPAPTRAAPRANAASRPETSQPGRLSSTNVPRTVVDPGRPAGAVGEVQPSLRSGRVPRTALVTSTGDTGPWSMVPDAAPPPPVSPTKMPPGTAERAPTRTTSVEPAISAQRNDRVGNVSAALVAPQLVDRQPTASASASASASVKVPPATGEPMPAYAALVAAPEGKPEQPVQPSARATPLAAPRAPIPSIALAAPRAPIPSIALAAPRAPIPSIALAAPRAPIASVGAPPVEAPLADEQTGELPANSDPTAAGASGGNPIDQPIAAESDSIPSGPVRSPEAPVNVVPLQRQEQPRAGQGSAGTGGAARPKVQIEFGHWFAAKASAPAEATGVPDHPRQDEEATSATPSVRNTATQSSPTPVVQVDEAQERVGLLSEADWAAIQWRLDSTTLRETADNRDALFALGERLDGRLTEEADSIAKAALLSLRAQIYRLLGELGMAAAAGRLALVHAEAARDAHSTVTAQVELAQVLCLRGDFSGADRLFAAAIEAPVSEQVRSMANEHAGRCCFDQGRHIEAMDHFAKAVRLGRPDDSELAARITTSVQAVYVQVLRDGWGLAPG